MVTSGDSVKYVGEKGSRMMRVNRPELNNPISIALEWVMLALETYDDPVKDWTDEHRMMLARYRAHYGDAPMCREFLLAVAAVEAMNQWEVVKQNAES